MASEGPWMPRMQILQQDCLGVNQFKFHQPMMELLCRDLKASGMLKYKFARQ